MAGFVCAEVGNFEVTQIMTYVSYSDEVEAEKALEELRFKPLSAEQAQAWRQRHSVVSPWRVVLWQLLVGLALGLMAWWMTGRFSVGESLVYGALAVIVPAALFARGLTGGFAATGLTGAVLGFFVWEAVKLVVGVVMLVIAPRVVSELSWPALLVGLVVTIKVYWLALLVSGRKADKQVR
jgi:ATP synthase protein I